MILSSHGIIGSSIVQFNANVPAQEFYDRITAAGGSLTSTEEAAILQLITDLNNAGIWTKMKAIYPMVGASAAACAQNLKSSSFTGTFTAGWTFSTMGATPNGTSAFMQTQLSPLNNLTNGNFHLSCYSNSISTLAAFSNEITVGNSTYTPLGWVGLRVNNKVTGTAGFSSGDDSVFVSASTSTAGFALGTETSNSLRKFMKNNSILATNTTLNTTALIVDQLCLAGFTGQNFSNNRNAFTSIGDGLTDTEASDFYTAVQAFQTTLSRQV